MCELLLEFFAQETVFPGLSAFIFAAKIIRANLGVKSFVDSKAADVIESPVK
jgi:hypothetical protein